MSTLNDSLPSFHRGQTFLGRAYEAEGVRASLQILAVRQLLAEAPADRREDARRWVNPRAFFYGLDLEGLQYDLGQHSGGGEASDRFTLYTPVGVLPAGDRQADPGLRQDELSDLLIELERRRGLGERLGDAGVLLLAGSGAGKTVAMLKAMFDCFEAPGNGAPKLAGYLPCVVRPSEELPKDPSLLDLLPYDEASAFDESREERRTRIERRLATGPPLLILCDLNAAPPEQQLRVAKALQRFQTNALRRRQGHRCVVAFRSTRRDDNVTQTLVRDEAFASFDLRRLSPRDAAAYVGKLRAIEAAITSRLGYSASRADDAAVERIGRLATSITSGAEPIISTPLLMHFASTLSAEAVDRVERLTDFYDEVVRAALRREFRESQAVRDAWRSFEEFARWARVALTRFALAVLATGEEEGGQITTLAKSDLRRLMLNPAAWARDHQAGWERMVGDDRQSVYASRNLLDRGELDRDSLLTLLSEHTLLSDDGGGRLSLVHDSLLYYFAAESLRLPEGDEDLEADRSDAAWQDTAGERIAAAPRSWLLPTRFLGSRLTPKETLGVLERVIPAEPRKGLASLVLAMCPPDGTELITDDQKILGVVRHAVRRFGLWCHRDARRVLPTSLSHLQSTSLGMARRLAHAIARRSPKTRLTPVRGFDAEGSLRIGNHGDWVKAICSLGDGRLASAGNNRVIRIWDLATGAPTTEPFEGHTDWVNALCVLSNGRLASAGHDCVIRIWDIATGESVGEPLVGHAGPIRSLCRLEGGLLASGGGDGVIRLWDVESGGALNRPLEGHRLAVVALCSLGDGRLASAGDDQTVRVWDLQTGELAIGPMIGHTDWVNAVCELRGRRLASAGEDRTIRIWSLKTGESLGLPIVGHTGSVYSLSESEDGRIVSAGADGRIGFWQMRDSSAPHGQIEAHAGGVTAMCLLENGRLASAGRDGDIRLWSAPATGSDQQSEGPVKAIRTICAVSNSRIASAGDDKIIRTWDATSGKQDGITLEGHEGAVQALCVTTDGLLVSADTGGILIVWRPEDGQMIRSIQGRRLVVSLCPTDDGCVIGAGYDGVISRIDVTAQEPTYSTIVRHSAAVKAMCMLGNGRIAVAGESGGVSIWNAQSGYREGGMPIVGSVKALCAVEESRLACASVTGAVSLWDVASGTLVAEHHTAGIVSALAWSDGYLVAAVKGAKPSLEWLSVFRDSPLSGSRDERQIRLLVPRGGDDG